MSEGPGANLAKLGERFMEGVPGFALVAILLGAVLPVALREVSETTQPGTPRIITQTLPVIVFVLAWLAYFLGHYLDDLIFDPIWGARGMRRLDALMFDPIWDMEFGRLLLFHPLNKRRTELADKWQRPVTGIFAKAEALLSGTELWEKKVKRPLEWSKAFRSLLILGLFALTLAVTWQWMASTWVVSLVLLLVPTKKIWSRLESRVQRFWATFKVPTAKFRTAFTILAFGISSVSLIIRYLLHTLGDRFQLRMVRPLVLVIAILMSATGYLLLRILHVRRLYDSAYEVEFHERNGIFYVGQKVVPARTVLLYAHDTTPEAKFQEADCFVQSLALMHVSLRTTTMNGRCSVPPGKKAQLYYNQLTTVETGTKAFPSPPLLHGCDPSQFDLIVEFKPEKGEEDQAELQKRLNGVI
jgi:hypothetical protein